MSSSSSTTTMSKELSDNVLFFLSHVKNKGFAILETTFKENGWCLVQNDMNAISFVKSGGDQLNSFDIRVTSEKIIVSIPLKNSAYQYASTFENYYDACEYAEQRFIDYISC